MTRFGFCNDGLFCVHKFNLSFDCNISKDWLIDKWPQASKKHSSWVISVQLILIYHVAASVRANIWGFYDGYSPRSWCRLTSHTLLTPNSNTHTLTYFEYFKPAVFICGIISIARMWADEWSTVYHLFLSVTLPSRASHSGAEDHKQSSHILFDLRFLSLPDTWPALLGYFLRFPQAFSEICRLSGRRSWNLPRVHPDLNNSAAGVKYDRVWVRHWSATSGTPDLQFGCSCCGGSVCFI